MFARAASGTLLGIDAQPVIVEAYRGKGLPGMALIGMARGAVRESLVRVRSAILASGLALGNHRLVINLLPAELPKEASALDLPLAVALCAAAGLLPEKTLEGRRFFGELSLGGGLENVQGAVLLADLARRSGDVEVIVPQSCAAEAAIIPNVRVIGAHNLEAVLAHLRGTNVIAPSVPVATAFVHSPEDGCIAEVFGQRRAKRALEIAAAGGHNLLLIGPPGSGKTMLARRLPGILPPLTPEECIEVTRIQSASGQLGVAGLVLQRPFRSPHHTASEAAMCGGGSAPRPGEVTMAHRGVLFLDELPEFARRTLESLREPLEEGNISIARAAMTLRFPAEVLLIAAMNPCPCGHAQVGNAAKKLGTPACLCAYEKIQRYRARISGPLLDRIDMHVPVRAVALRTFGKQSGGDTSAQVRARVHVARAHQYARLGTGRTNASMRAKELAQYVPCEAKTLRLLERAMTRYGLSARALGRIRKVARTIADLDKGTEVTTEHLREALSYRLLDRQELQDVRETV